MPSIREHPGLPNRIRGLRKADGRKISTDDFGAGIGVSGGAVRNWESGRGGISLDNLSAIEHVFGVSRDWLLRGEGEMVRHPRVVSGPAPKNTGVDDGRIPVRAAQIGRGDFFVITETVIDSIARPQPLLGRTEGFGVLVPGESMTPAFRYGDIAIIDPALAPSTDCEVIAMSQSLADGGSANRALLGTLTNITDDEWIIETIHPTRTEHKLRRDEWITLRVVAKIARR